VGADTSRRRPLGSKDAVHLSPEGPSNRINRPTWSCRLFHVSPSASETSSAKWPSRYLIATKAPEGSVTLQRLPAASYSKVVAFPSGSISLAIRPSESYSVWVLAPSGPNSITTCPLGSHW